jgi:hypothetical protein
MSDSRFWARVVLTEHGKPEQLLVLDMAPNGHPMFMTRDTAEALYSGLGEAIAQFDYLVRKW